MLTVFFSCLVLCCVLCLEVGRVLSQLGWLVGWEKPNIETTQHSFVYSESIYSQQSHPITASFFFTSLFTSNIQNLLLNHIYSESNGLSRLSTSTSLSLSRKKGFLRPLIRRFRTVIRPQPARRLLAVLRAVLSSSLLELQRRRAKAKGTRKGKQGV